MKRNSAKEVALGGLMAALAIVIMCLGGLIPFATFVCPMFCCMITKLVLSICGRRIAVAWYAAVAMLSMLMAPDKEAAAVFVFLGYYPIVKPWMDKRRLGWIYKAILFNAAILIMYWLLIHILGMSDIAAEYEEAGKIMTAVMLLLGNITFFMLDMILGRKFRKICKR
jgi:hypothetical protein